MEKVFGFLATFGFLMISFWCLQNGYLAFGMVSMIFGLFALIGTLNTP